MIKRVLARNGWEKKKGAYHHTLTQDTHHTRTNEVKPHAKQALPRSDELNWIHNALMPLVKRNVLAKEGDKKLQGTSTRSCRHTSSTGPRTRKKRSIPSATPQPFPCFKSTLHARLPERSVCGNVFGRKTIITRGHIAKK